MKLFQQFYLYLLLSSIGDNAEHIEIAVRDNGPGIAPECMDKLFDPFFITKGRCCTGSGELNSYYTGNSPNLLTSLSQRQKEDL